MIYSVPRGTLYFIRKINNKYNKNKKTKFIKKNQTKKQHERKYITI